MIQKKTSDNEPELNGSFSLFQWNLSIMKWGGISGSYMDVGPVGYPTGDLLRPETADLQLVGVGPLRLPLRREVDERGGGVHVQLGEKVAESSRMVVQWFRAQSQRHSQTHQRHMVILKPVQATQLVQLTLYSTDTPKLICHIIKWPLTTWLRHAVLDLEQK